MKSLSTCLLLVVVFVSIVQGHPNSRVKRVAGLYIDDMKYPGTKDFQAHGFSQQQKDNLVHIHNALRSLVKPFAADMVEMTWDDDIAAYSQEWADRCTATHTPHRNLDGYINMGQNLFWWFGGRYNEAQATEFWWDELSAYDFETQACTNHSVCGHYITLVWAKSEKLGCGISRCDRLSDLPDYGRGAYYIVCDYSGRFVSHIHPYTATDMPCSNCHKTEFPKCRYNLCVSQDMIDNNIGYNGSTDITEHYRTFTYSHAKSNGEKVVEPEPGTSFYAKWLAEEQTKKKHEHKKHHG